MPNKKTASLAERMKVVEDQAARAKTFADDTNAHLNRVDQRNDALVDRIRHMDDRIAKCDREIAEQYAYTPGLIKGLELRCVELENHQHDDVKPTQGTTRQGARTRRGDRANIILYANDGFQVDIGETQDGEHAFLVNFRTPSGGVLTLTVDEDREQTVVGVGKRGSGKPFDDVVRHLARG